jgi:hypothetical protein
MATVGAFRVVSAEELTRLHEDPRVATKDLERLQDLDLLRTMPCVVGHERTKIVTLTEAGRTLLTRARDGRGADAPQTFYAGIAKPRELAHDVRVHSAYVKTSERLVAEGNRVRRVVLEQELKREYQTFLQAPNRGRRESTGRPQRDPVEVARWAQEHQLPMVEDRVQFPDLRIEYERPDGRRDREDIEVMTPHYRGTHAASKVSAGFTRYQSAGGRIGGAGGGGRGARGRDPRLAEEMLS